MQESASQILQRATALFRQQRFADAEALCTTVIGMDSRHADAYQLLGIIAASQGEVERAGGFMLSAIEICPDNALFYLDLGIIFRKQFRFEDALSAYSKSIELNPNIPEAHSNRGNILKNLGRFEDALRSYQEAIRLKPDFALAHSNYAQLLLLMGDLENGFREREWRWRTPEGAASAQRFSQPAWNGERLGSKTILIYAEQGLGDTLQFIRYLPLVSRMGGKVVVECQAELKRLLANMPGVDVLVARGEALPDFHVHAAITSLPFYFRTNLDNIPSIVPYLTVPNPVASDLSSIEFNSGSVNIGFVWAGNPEHKNDRRRSVPVEEFNSVVSIPGTRWVSLQLGGEVGNVRKIPGVLDMSPRLHDFADTAWVIQQLDLVICVDTAIAHLSGAIKSPVWVLLPRIPDWRWLTDREDSPWYPTMRLFRQTGSDDWSEVFVQIKHALDALVTRKSGGAKF